MRSALLSLDQDWQISTDWYDDLFTGVTHSTARPRIEALERDRILRPTQEDWEQGPAHVNAILAQIEAEYRPTPLPPEIPDQEPSAMRYARTDRRIGINDLAGSDEISDDPETVQLHAQSLRSVQALRSATEDHRQGDNRPNRLRDLATDIEAALGELPSEVKSVLLVTLADELQSELEADDDRRADTSELSGEKLDPDQRVPLSNAINATQRFINLNVHLSRINGGVHVTVEQQLDTASVRVMLSAGIEDQAITVEVQTRLEAQMARRPNARFTAESVGNLVRFAAKVALADPKIAIAKWFWKRRETILKALKALPELARTIARVYEDWRAGLGSDEGSESEPEEGEDPED
jgi:hypothetical protein